MDSTERSISPAMTISVIGSAMIATSMRADRRFEKLLVVRKNGESAFPSRISPMSAISSTVSQRASERVHDRVGAAEARLRGHRARRSAVRVRWIRRRMMVSTLTAARITTP